MVVALASAFARRIGEVGLLLGFLGALMLAWGARVFLVGDQSGAARRGERARYLWGALFVGGAFLLLLISEVVATH